MGLELQKGQEILARLDRIPVWPFSRLVLFTVGIGFFFAFFDIVSIGLALPVIVTQMHTTTEMGLASITSSLIGYIIGSFLDSRVADLLGRRLALFISISFFSIGSLFAAFSPNIEYLIIARFIIGMGIGSEIANVSTYISELSPKACRGKASCQAIAYGFIGFALVPFVALLLVPNFEWGWRILFLMGGLGGIITLILRRHIPNSIRFYVAQSRFSEAEAILDKAEIKARNLLGHDLPAARISNHITQLSSGGIGHLFKPPHLYKVIYFVCLWFIYYVGNYGWLTMGTELFVKEGFSLPKSLMLVSISALGFILGSFLAVRISDRFERKWTAAVVAFIWSFALLLIGFFPQPITVMICGFIASATISTLVPLLYTYTAENFPTSFRTTGVSITDGLGHLGGAFCGQIILAAYMLFHPIGFGFQAAFGTMALSGLITAVLLFFGNKMTRKGLSQ